MSDSASIALLCESKLFDDLVYSERLNVAFESRQAAADHYLQHGHLNLPSDLFDPVFYLRRYPDVAAAGMNPLLHYLKHGASEGRLPRLSRSPPMPAVSVPEPGFWEEIALAAQNRERSAEVDTSESVDVVVPVYAGENDTLACLAAALGAKNTTPFRLIVINDCSPEPSLSQALKKLAALGLFTLIENDRNLGFVGTANRGLSLSEHRDTILLNADAIAFGDWIDRLRAHTQIQKHVASVTPFSNNATILSYPFFNAPNTQKVDIGDAALDGLFASFNRGQSLEIPTGVGFCFYMPRAAIKAVGSFDERAFGKGYGEENDYCFRAAERGWINIAALDVFVRHTGEVSFASGAAHSKLIAGRRLANIHPRFDRLVGQFVAEDPLKPARQRIDIARFAARSAGRGILMVNHQRGGGIDRHVAELTALLERDGVPVLIWSPSDFGDGLKMRHGHSDDYPNLPNVGWHEIGKIPDLLRSLKLASVHFHSTADIPQTALLALISAITEAGLPYDVTLHDYLTVCPRLTMLDWSGSFCDSPGSAYCRVCLHRAGSPFGEVDVDDWRLRQRRFLENARLLLAPSENTARRVKEKLPLRRAIAVRPHPYPVDRLVQKISPWRGGAIRRIAIIGSIGDHKGLRVLRCLAADAQTRQLSLHFTVFGSADLDDAERFTHLDITGLYREKRLPQLLAAKRCDLALFLSLAPETFSFTLDHAIENGLYPVTLDIGAPAERIRAIGWGEVIPYAWIWDPRRLNDRLLELMPEPPNIAVAEVGRQWISADRFYENRDGAVR